MQGYAALEFNGNSCYLVDFFINHNSEIIENFIFEILKIANQTGANQIITMLNPGGNYTKNFLKMGFKSELNSSNKVPFEVYLQNDDKDFNFITDLNNWYLTYMDIDIESVTKTLSIS